MLTLMLLNVVDNYEQCCSDNIVVSHLEHSIGKQLLSNFIKFNLHHRTLSDK